MKSVLVIGMGKFGTFLAQKMSEMGNEVMVVDKSPEVAAELSHIFGNVLIGDCTKREVLDELNIDNYDVCFVAIDEDFQSSLEITCLLHEMGARCIVSKTSRETQEKFLKLVGADEVIYPDKDSAEKTAMKYHAKNVLDYIPISGDDDIYELPIIEEWVGKTIEQINVRRVYKFTILAVKKANEVIPSPMPSYAFVEGDHILIFGKQSDVLKFDKKI